MVFWLLFYAIHVALLIPIHDFFPNLMIQQRSYFPLFLQEFKKYNILLKLAVGLNREWSYVKLKVSHFSK